MTSIAAVAVPAEGHARLAPGETHAMLEGLRAGLVRGDSLAVTFQFAHAGPIAVQARIIEYAQVDSATGASHTRGR
jgi:hypothetical protein